MRSVSWLRATTCCGAVTGRSCTTRSSCPAVSTLANPLEPGWQSSTLRFRHLGSGVPSAHVLKYGTLQATVSPPRLAMTRCRRRQYAIRETEGDVDARPDGRSAATTAAHARRRALSRNLQPYPGEASDLWHRADLSQDGRSRRLCRRGSASMVRNRRAQVDHGPDGAARVPGPPIDRGRTRDALNDARCRTGTAAHAAPERADPARSLRGDRRRRQPARPARSDGAAILLAVEIATHQADPLPRQ